MSRTTRLDDEALDEIVAVARYYEEREHGRGKLFSDAVFAGISESAPWDSNPEPMD